MSWLGRSACDINTSYGFRHGRGMEIGGWRRIGIVVVAAIRAPHSRRGHAEVGVSGHGCLARPASSAASTPLDGCGRATTGALTAATLIAQECQVACRTASPISPSALPPLRPPPPGLPCLSYHAGAAAALQHGLVCGDNDVGHHGHNAGGEDGHDDGACWYGAASRLWATGTGNEWSCHEAHHTAGKDAQRRRLLVCNARHPAGD